MRVTLFFTLGLILLCGPGRGQSAEMPAQSRIVGVGLFKNGLAVVRRELTVPQEGTYVLDDVPQPVHGTYWIESSAPVESVVQLREVEIPVGETMPANLQEDFAGKQVSIYFKGARLPAVNGTILQLKPKPGRDSSIDALARYRGDSGVPAHFLVVQTSRGRAYLDISEIAYVEAVGTEDKVKRRLPRLLLKVAAPTKVTVSYLTHGIGWAPSYRLDISNPKTLILEQQAVIRNELADLNGAEIKLISGFPSVQFAHVTSPLSTSTTWAAFFQQLNQRVGFSADSMRNSVVTQNMASFNTRANFSGVDLAATPMGEGVDLHYQSIGKRTLAEGESLALSLATAKADYERIVEWLVPDTRDEYGRQVEGRRRGDDGDEAQDGAWDALKFKNPFHFAMTTGPASVFAAGNFNGQRTSYWVNAGEETVLRVNKALSVRTRSLEHEEQKNVVDAREIVWIGGRQFRKSSVQGELSVNNHRNETIHLVLRRRFSGELVSADVEPRSTLREEGVYSINRRWELLWSLPLKPGEEKKLTYRYTVLVAH